MRQLYKKGGHYERQQILKNAQIVKEQIKRKTTQYKIHCKERLEEHGKAVVEALF